MLSKSSKWELDLFTILQNSLYRGSLYQGLSVFFKGPSFFSSLLLEETFNFNFYTPFFMGNFCGHLFCFHFTFCLMILSILMHLYHLNIILFGYFWHHYAANQHGIFSFFLSISRKTPISVVE